MVSKTHEGQKRNLPSVRSGIISMMPIEPIEHPTRHIDQESYLIEMRSISRFSGSPVFVKIGQSLLETNTVYDQGRRVRAKHTYQSGALLDSLLLGIDWGHIYHDEWILDEDGEELPERWKVRSNSGIAQVVPAWKLLDLLNEEELVVQRKKQEQVEKAKREKSGGGAVLDSETKAGVFTREDFEKALRKVSRPDKPDDKGKGDKSE